MDVRTLSTDERHLCCLVNTYYYLMEAADMILRESEKLLSSQNKVLQFDIKRRHNMMMNRIQALKGDQDKFLADYSRAFQGEWLKYDDLRRSGALMARIALLIADRTYSPDSISPKEQMIEKFIYSLPTNSTLSNELLSKFTIR